MAAGRGRRMRTPTWINPGKEFRLHRVVGFYFALTF